ncbi:ferrous iron transport protein A [Cellulomonas cellasea]|uniref:FeoA family protein n=1 Tax=Cellulomonas cellasea TaxID=43670 RepID=UPI0025A4249D|nr:ferrous iron transport protein A [Cellulomonas cellasea]MDM8083524.1 ferrous iron transport protein A [Cellulomonas cellasea]
MNLAQSPVDARARVVDLDTEQSMRLRMNELGLRVGAVVRVTQRAAFGGRVVAIGAQRFAVDGQTAARIHVEPVLP